MKNLLATFIRWYCTDDLTRLIISEIIIISLIIIIIIHWLLII